MVAEAAMAYSGGKKKKPTPYPFTDGKITFSSSRATSPAKSNGGNSDDLPVVKKSKPSKADGSWMMLNPEGGKTKSRAKSSSSVGGTDDETVSCGTVESLMVTADDGASSTAFASIGGSPDDEEMAVDDDSKDGANKLNLSCMKCQAVVKQRTDLLLIPEGEDWCGKLWGHCLECSGLDAAAFRREVKKVWHKRAKVLFGKADALRTLKWKTLAGYLQKTYPGSTKKEQRSIAELRIKAVGLAAALSAYEENELVQEAYGHVDVEYEATIDKVCTNIGLPSAQIKHAETDYLTAVTKAIQVSYMCRKRDCGFYGMNDQWVQHDTKYWFRCPHCATQYMPWKADKKFYPFQKVVSVSHPLTGERWVIPALWPDSAEDNYLQQLMLVTASNIQAQGDLDAFMEGKVQDLNVLLGNVGVPGIFKRFEMTMWVKDVLRTCAGYPASQYAKLEEAGYHGNILDPKVGAQEPFKEWHEFACIFGSLMKGGERAARNLKI